jgi:hypothetical protein
MIDEFTLLLLTAAPFVVVIVPLLVTENLKPVPNTAVTRFPPIASVTLLLTMTTQSAIPTSVIGVVLLLETVTGQTVADAYPVIKPINAIVQLIFRYLFNFTQLI